MIELIARLGIAAGVTVVAYGIVNKLLGPLVAYVLDRKKAADSTRPKADRVTALEINLTNLTTQVLKLENAMGARATETQNLFEERAIAADNKMDMVLAELKSLREDHAEAHRQLGERIMRAETNIEHLLRGGRSRHA